MNLNQSSERNHKDLRRMEEKSKVERLKLDFLNSTHIELCGICGEEHSGPECEDPDELD